ncbi:hypothetical protein GH742_01190 [Legionella sp. MW5194]|uniref:hypothetical protein n=1 Tax=Legionella sp. MW5194 TaxID=2662448 RepID=UPI00193CEC83|nr:hypothetical protein [Legionella sp. MW5194]QRN02598.1 hypothetical protein GH742_01190 [Legionella sp. MW5194]
MFNVHNVRDGKETLLLELENNLPRVTSAVFDLFPLAKEDEERLIQIIKNNTHLESLSLLGCRLTPAGTEAIMDAVMGNAYLKHVAIEVCQDDTLSLHTKKEAMDDHLNNNANTPSPR